MASPAGVEEEQAACEFVGMPRPAIEVDPNEIVVVDSADVGRMIRLSARCSNIWTEQTAMWNTTKVAPES
ncbi:MAG: hypothetical protein ACK55I_20450 [bacterium]